MMARLTRKDMQQQTRQRLLAAAEREIIQHGIQSASIRNISESAGYSLGAFYSNFVSKEAMLQELMELRIREEIQAFRQIVTEARENDTIEMLALISAWLKTMLENISPTLGLEFQIYANRNPPFKQKFDKVKTKRQLELAEVLKTLFSRKGLLPTMDPLQMATGFAALWSGLAVQGDVPWAKPFEQVFLTFLGALLDNATPVEEVGEALENSDMKSQ